MTFKDIMVHVTEAFEKGGYDFDKQNIEISINKRLTKTLGRCMCRKCGEDVWPYRIEFSAQFLETATDQCIIDVIYHECAHALVTIDTGVRHGHDAVFKAMCAKIGTKNDGTTTEVERTVEDTAVYKYCVYCNTCGKMVGRYHRAGKVVQYPGYYTCKCGGSLRVVQNY